MTADFLVLENRQIDRFKMLASTDRHLTEALPVIPKNKETLKIFARAYGVRDDLLIKSSILSHDKR